MMPLMSTEILSPEALPVKASHDTVNPPNLISFMLKNWKPATGKLPPALKNLGDFRRRRGVLAKLFPGEMLLIPSGHLKVRANDDHYRFRPSSDFYYLTGNQEPDCVLAVMTDKDGKAAEVLFVEPNPGKTDASFYTDRIKGELWEGARLGVPESRARYGLDDTRALSSLEEFIRTSVSKGAGKVRVLRGHSASLETSVGRIDAAQLSRDEVLSTALSEMRLIKDPQELKEMASAVNATGRGFEDVIQRLKTAKNERELEGVFYTRARIEGNDVGYGSIVASGAHGCTLHWRKNDGQLRKGDLLLLDAGIEGNTLYTADITRTLPISGKFSPAQREIYELVLKAQKAALKAVKPGNDFMEPNRVAMKVLAHGLEELRILPTSAEEALRDENQFYKRYSLHNVSHMLGLEVHDCATARAQNYKYGKLKAGMVLTVEPGLYFQVDDLTVPVKYRGIGIRIEDDVVVTAKGSKNLSAGIPTEVKEIEAWMKKLWSRK
ncbi:MAG: aminopeptidase P family protein [Methylotenera sp.]|nr:aminopeptidase P family protein [Oligoflexia bacterium]